MSLCKDECDGCSQAARIWIAFDKMVLSLCTKCHNMMQDYGEKLIPELDTLDEGLIDEDEFIVRMRVLASR